MTVPSAMRLAVGDTRLYLYSWAKLLIKVGKDSLDGLFYEVYEACWIDILCLYKQRSGKTISV